MSLCINPQCNKPDNPDTSIFCVNCGSELLLQGRYRVVKVLGSGGFGKTFEVISARSSIPKVLKVLVNDIPKAVELFQQEADVLSKLEHPGIPRVERDGYFVYFPKDTQQPVHCLVMEKVVGLDLEQYMSNRRLRPIDTSLVIDWLRELVSILEKVHSQSFFHRDIKPPNIMLRSSGELALIDFGTARQVTRTVVNQQGGVTGIISAGYTPQEQINNNAVPQSDFFALGRTFVYLLTGRNPLDAEIYDTFNDELKWRSHAQQVPSQLADLLDEMMAHKPNQSPANNQVILQRLEEIENELYSSRPVVKTDPGTVAEPPDEAETPNNSQVNPISKKGFTNNELRLFISWVGANCLGYIVIFFIVNAASHAGIYSGSELFSMVLFGCGVVLGSIQWLALRYRISFSQIIWWKWSLATAVGITIGNLFPQHLGNIIYSLTDSNSLLISLILFTIASALFAIPQWLLIRSVVSKSIYWILAYIGAFQAALIVFRLVLNGYDLGVLVLAVIGGTFTAMATGGVLVWFSRNPKLQHSKQN